MTFLSSVEECESTFNMPLLADERTTLLHIYIVSISRERRVNDETWISHRRDIIRVQRKRGKKSREEEYKFIIRGAEVGVTGGRRG